MFVLSFFWLQVGDKGLITLGNEFGFEPLNEFNGLCEVLNLGGIEAVRDLGVEEGQQHLGDSSGADDLEGQLFLDDVGCSNQVSPALALHDRVGSSLCFLLGRELRSK